MGWPHAERASSAVRPLETHHRGSHGEVACLSGPSGLRRGTPTAATPSRRALTGQDLKKEHVTRCSARPLHSIAELSCCLSKPPFGRSARETIQLEFYGIAGSEPISLAAAPSRSHLTTRSSTWARGRLNPQPRSCRREIRAISCPICARKSSISGAYRQTGCSQRLRIGACNCPSRLHPKPRCW
jgi:hypothetical protein